MSSTIAKYISIIENTPDLTQEEETRLIKAIRKGDIKAKEKFFNSFTKLVLGVAKHYTIQNIALEDLVEEGFLGIESALETFDISMGNRFSTHAKWWVQAKIKKHIRANIRPFNVPTGATGKIFAINKSIEKLGKQLTHTPTNQEIAQDVNLDEAKTAFYRKFLNPSLSVNELISDQENGSTELEDLLVDDRNDGREALIRNDGIKKVKEAIEKLSPIQRSIIEYRYGLKGTDDLTLKKVGDKLDLTAERVRQIQNQAEVKLKLLINR